MQTQAIRNTGVELALRKELWTRGVRYRVDRPFLPGNNRRRADIVFPRSRVAVDCRGCFWHGCPDHGRRRFKTNTWYWPAKIERNRARDADTERLAAEAGWALIVVWEHEDPVKAADRVQAAIEKARTTK